MSQKEEVQKVIEWCEQKKKEAGRTPIIETNPFKDIFWLRNKTLIQIDRDLDQADKNGIVYDSIIHALFEYMNGTWRKIIP